MREIKLIIISIIASISIFAIIFIFTTNNKIPNIPMPWESKIYNKKTSVFGLTLGVSTLKDAMRIFGTELEIALFKNKNNSTSLEAYFDNTKIGGLSAKIIIGLITNNNIYQMLNDNISNHKMMPSGNEKIKFNDFANSQLLNLTIDYINFIPIINIDDDTLLLRFGAPNIKKDNFWLYKQKGLKIIKTDELQILEYSNFGVNL